MDKAYKVCYADSNFNLHLHSAYVFILPRVDKRITSALQRYRGSRRTEMHVLTHKEFFMDASSTQPIQSTASTFAMHHTEERSLNLHAALSELINTITLPLRLPEMLHLLTDLIAESLHLDLCLIMLRGPANDALQLCASSPALVHCTNPVANIHIPVALWEHLHTYTLQGQLPRLTAQEEFSLNPLKDFTYKTLLCIPLCVGHECLGLLNCYANEPLYFSSDEQLLLNTIVNQTALAIKHRRYVEADVIEQKNLIKAFVDELLSGKADVEPALQRQSYMLGFDLLKPHIVVLIELAESTDSLDEQIGFVPLGQERLVHYETALTRIKQNMQATYPSVLIDERNNGLFCLLPCDTVPSVECLNAQLEPLIQTIQQECHIAMAVGVGTCCQTIGDYARSSAEAREALQISLCLQTEVRSAHFAALGAYRYLYPFARANNLTDQYQQCIAAVLTYDLRKKTNLFDTLEAYLECGGNIARTASMLEVHRNTLLQRISRMQKICTLDLDHIQHHLPLLMALKIYRLRAHQMPTNESILE